MWLFTRYGFYSISIQNGKTVVRARLKKHLLNLIATFGALGKPVVIDTPEADYAHRIIVDPTIWAKVVQELVTEQTWSNFKNEVMSFNGADDYEHSCHDVWSVMNRLQQQEKQRGLRGKK